MRQIRRIHEGTDKREVPTQPMENAWFFSERINLECWTYRP